MPSRTLEQCLIEVHPARLEAIARHWGSEQLPARRRQAAAALAERMLAPGQIERAWAGLSADERAALSALQLAGDRMPWLTFVRLWGQVRGMGPGRMERERPWETPVSPVEGLWYRGLVFRVSTEGPTGIFEMAFVPDELASALPVTPLTPSASPLRLEPIGVPPVVLPAGDHLLDDACTLLAYLQNHGVRPGPEGQWPSPEEVRFASRLRSPSPDGLGFLRHLAARLGWLRTDRRGHLRPDPEPAAAWLQASTAGQRVALAQAWRDDPTWNDLWQVPTLRPDDTGSWHNDPLLARQAILRHLAALRPGEWYELAGFVAAVKEVEPDFQRPDGDYSAWYIRDASGAHLRGFEAWDAVEGALIRYLVTGPIAWLGLADLGDQEGAADLLGMDSWRASAFRLSSAGSVLLGLIEGTLEAGEEPPPLKMKPDLTVLVPAARRYERFQLSRVADWVGKDPYVYRLTPSSLERARRQRIGPERVKAFLDKATCGNVPSALSVVLGRWTQRGPEVRLERGVLLRVKDRQLLRELAAAPPTRRLIGEVVGPTTAVVAAADWPRLVRALVERGLLPDLIGLEDDAG